MEDEFRRLYSSQIEQYVNDNIISSLLIGYGEGVYNRNELERINLTLCNKLLGNPELRAEIVKRLVEHGINLTRSYFKSNLIPELRDKIVMDKLHNVLNYDQIVKYAIKFDKDLENEKAQTR